jgi:hypothetical protein
LQTANGQSSETTAQLALDQLINFSQRTQRNNETSATSFQCCDGPHEKAE